MTQGPGNGDQERPLAGRRIGYLLEGPDRVGANLVQQMLALRDLGADVIAIFMAGDPAAAELDGADSQRLGLRLPKKALSGTRLRLAWHLRKALQRTVLDTLVCDQYKAVTAAALATALPFSGRPRLYALLRGFYATDSRSRQRVYHLIGRQLAGIITLTNPQRERVCRNLRHYPPAQVHVVHNYIDADAVRGKMLDRTAAREFLGVPAEAFVFGCIARFDPYKRITDLLQAFSRIRDEAPESRLVIIGDGKESPRLRAEATALALGEHVVFTGFVPGASRYMRAFDVFVLPSEGDNFARVFLEAMTCQLPVVGVDAGGTSEVLAQIGGALVPARDNGSLASSMLQLVTTSPSERAGTGAEIARAGEKRFNKETLQAHLLAAFVKRL